MTLNDDTIVAPASATGGAIAVVRLSGPEAFSIADAMFSSPHGHKTASAKGYTMLRGEVVEQERSIDDVVVSVFRAPNSYTGDDTVEIACHGSQFIVSEILRRALSLGARSAEAGEFTRRAFLAGKIDLSQAEAVADTIAAESLAASAMASTQMRGNYSEELQKLREKLLRLASLLELELDFSEEDVKFADRTELVALLDQTAARTRQLSASFATGNAIKQGIAVAIVGAPNVGKSTLLNRLVGDERAMVSEIAGTTRDTIEESVTIDGVRFRMVDTAGLRQTDDPLEKMGIERAMKAVQKADVVIEITDGESLPPNIDYGQRRVLHVTNKIDRLAHVDVADGTIAISAKYGEGIGALKKALRGTIDTDAIMRGEAVVSSIRHYDALCRATASLDRAREGLADGTPTELVAQDVREVLGAIGEITGAVTSQDILTSIFSNFCIGK
ncbi:MAG: tRNA uridine-5-carboxymethylaminomethyl(34) synthesis GTPase MnmE [Tidjanibacter sp.]|nr:tRNA uridine-5-carboxymethylaminomethyl(34) synthesis GTPase MnmE [Tidjanibacter sp.]